MENPSHSLHPNTLHHHHHLKKTSSSSYFTNAAAAAAAAATTTFTAPATTLSPRLEDYAEIFASRATSIPVLDLPPNDVASQPELFFFDVRASLFDYSEVFGGYNESDFAVSYEELLRSLNSSGDEAWTPEEGGYESEESDQSAKNQSLSNRGSYESIDGVTEFNISYHKASRGSSEDMSNGFTHVARLQAVDGYTFLVDKSNSLSAVDDHSDFNFNEEMVRERRLRKTVSHPPNSGGQQCGNDLGQFRRIARNGSLPNETFVTISDLSLKTQPSELPPPSRPPPALATGTAQPSKLPSNGKSFASDGSSCDSSPPHFDAEVDASSSAAASTAAMKEAMEKAQAQLKSAKELMESNRKGFQTHTRSRLKNVKKDKEGKVMTQILNNSSSCSKENAPEFIVSGDKQNAAEVVQPCSNLLGGKKHLHGAKPSLEPIVGSESLCRQGSDDIDEIDQWEEASEFLELVRTSKPTKVIDQVEYDFVLPQSTNTHELGKMKRKTSMDKVEYYHDYRERKANNGWSEVVRLEDGLKESEKMVQATQHGLGQEGNEKMFGMEQQHAETRKKNIGSNWSKEFESGVDIQLQDGTHLAEKDIEKYEEARSREAEKRLKEVIDLEENDKRLKIALGKEEEKKKLRLALEKEENDRKLKEALEMEENKRGKRDAIERVENESRCREAFECEESVADIQLQDCTLLVKQDMKKYKEASTREEKKRLREAIDREEHDTRLKVALEKEEKEKKLRLALEKEENDRKLKDALEMEENERRQREAIEQEENERRCREAFEREEKERIQREAIQQKEEERRQIEAIEQEEEERRQREAIEREESEKRHREAVEREESEKRHREAVEREVNERRQREAVEREENERRQREAMEKEDDERRQREAVEREENKRRQREAMEREENERRQREAMEREENETRQREAVEQEENERKQREAIEREVYERRQREACARTEIEEKIKENEEQELKDMRHRENSQREENEKKVEDALEQDLIESHKGDDNVKDWKDNSERVVAGGVMSFDGEEVGNRATNVKLGMQRIHQVSSSKSSDREVTKLQSTLSDKKEAESLKKEMEVEAECLRKLEEEREREREREKDRMTTKFEAREKQYIEARERAERVAVERAMNEARERLERACAEAREKTLPPKILMDARIRVERLAVERANAEARELAFEKARAERVDSVSNNFSSNSARRMDVQSSESQPQAVGSFDGSRFPNSTVFSEKSEGVKGESPQRCKARLERHRRVSERAAKALAEKNMRDLLAQKEQAERNRLAETLDADVKRWSSGKEGNLRALLSTLQYILGPDSGWHPIPLTEVITSAAVKRAYRKATLCVHPDKLQQRGASIQQKYICEKVFDLLKDAWNKFNSEER